MTTPIANGLDTELRAFSCSSPSGLKDYMVHYNESCGSPLAPDDQQLRSYTIVQRRNYNPAQGYRCTKRVSRFTFVCTSNALANHQRMASIPQVEVPQDMTREECQNLVMNEEYEGPDGVKYQVPMNKTTVLRFHEAGREEITGGTITCYGEKLKVGNRLIDGVAILEQVKFHVQAMTFRVDATTATVETREDHRRLPCTAFYHFCVTSEGTYLWEQVASTMFQKVRIFSAQLESKVDQRILVSHDQKIRLALGDVEMHEGRSYYNTKYPDIYVVEGEAQYLDVFPSDHLRLTAWVAARDDFITWSMEKKILEAYDAMADTTCRRKKDLLRTQMATSYTSGDVSHHLHLGHNQFGAIIGEVLYVYQCQAVTVTPREETRCTKELPVLWQGHNYYLEPVSRLLKRYGAPVPCSHMMPSKFLTLDGRWIAATPQLLVTRAPAEIMEVTGGHFNLTHEDMSEGGLYTASQLAEFTRLLDYPRTKALVANSIYQEACVGNKDHVCLAFTETLGHTMGSPTNLLNLRNKVLTFLHTFGEASAICIVCYFLGMWIKALVDIAVSCVTLRHVAGRRRWWMPLVPLSWTISYDYGQASRQARKQQQQEERQEQAEEMRHLRQQALSDHHLSTIEEQDKNLLSALEHDEGFKN